MRVASARTLVHRDHGAAAPAIQSAEPTVRTYSDPPFLTGRSRPSTDWTHSSCLLLPRGAPGPLAHEPRRAPGPLAETLLPIETSRFPGGRPHRHRGTAGLWPKCGVRAFSSVFPHALTPASTHSPHTSQPQTNQHTPPGSREVLTSKSTDNEVKQRAIARRQRATFAIVRGSVRTQFEVSYAACR